VTIPPDLLLKLTILLNLYFLLLTLYNIRYLHRNSTHTEPLRSDSWTPKVSVILPVRNEESQINRCLDSLLEQTYENYEVIAVDDNSEDGTSRILEERERTNARLRVVKGRPLPEGWNGKSFACSQGVAVADGDYLLFTDADTVHRPESILWALQIAREHDADLVSAYVRQQLGNLGELLIVPVMFIMTALLLPLGLVPRKNSSTISFAIGQFMICRSDAFRAIDAYDRFHDSVVEDVSMAREMKRSGYKTMFLDAQSYISCRMYDGFSSAFRGIAKSLFGAINSSVVALLALAAIIILAIVYPFFVAMSGVLGGEPVLSPASIPVGLFALTWLAKMYDRHISLLSVVLYPITFFCLILVALYSAVKTGFGAGLEWKGRLVTAHACDSNEKRRPIPIVNFSPLYRILADAVFTVTVIAVFIFAKLALGLRIEGREHLACGTGRRRILISNHVLYLDAAMVACAIYPKRTFFSALEETFSIPVIGSYIRLLGAFPLPERNTFRRIAVPLDRMFAMGRFVHVFPEGELHRLNRETTEFKAGAFFLACLHEALVIPVTFVLLDRPVLGRFLHGAFRVKIVIQDALDSRDYLERYPTRTSAIRALTQDARDRMNRTLRAEARESLSGSSLNRVR